MVFSSLTFLYCFLPIVMLLYYISPMKVKNLIILVSGLLFYAWGEPFYVVIMIISTLIDYTAGRLMDKYDDRPKVRLACLLVSVIMNLGLLAAFKYSDFILAQINGLFGTELVNPMLSFNRSLNSLLDLGLPENHVRLPIGISFYTFQSMSYTIDLYLRNIKVQKNIISFTSFVTLFPQIVAGPIVRYEDVAAEIDDREVNISKSAEGIGIFLKGLAKKVILANNIGALWTTVKAMDYSEISVVTAWIGILAFTFQIYFDFSGYSDMAIGLGKMLGFNFPKNFDHPYLSKSISEFWRRWHMTLGGWFRSYVYIPMGGNRCGKWKTLRNLLVVWGLTGLWHGASWNFILWGLYFGILIIAERLGWGDILKKLPAPMSICYTFVLVVFGWVLFDIDGLTPALQFFNAMFGGTGIFIDATAKYLFSAYILVFIVCIFASTDLWGRFVAYLKKKQETLVLAATPVAELLVLLSSTAYLVDATYNPFLYFRF